MQIAKPKLFQTKTFPALCTHLLSFPSSSEALRQMRLVQWVNHVSPNPDGRQSASYVKRFLPCPHTDPAHSKLVEHLMSPRRREKNVHLLNGKTRTKKDHILTCDTYLINPQVLHVPSEFKNPNPPWAIFAQKVARAILAHGTAWKNSLGEKFCEKK